MTDGKSIDHWNFLAQQLGAAPAPEPEEETKPAEPAETAETAAEVAPVIESQPELCLEVETTAVSEPLTASIPAIPSKPSPPSPPSPPSRPPAAKPKPRNHWRELAATLGIEISEPEPEEPEVAEAVAPSDLAEPVAPPEPPAPVIRPPKPIEREVDSGSRRWSDARREDHRPSLFDDPDLSLDTPGVLDAVFDEIQPTEGAEPDDIFERRQPEPFDSELESRDRFAPPRLDELFPAEAEEPDIDEAPVEAAAEPVEAREALDVDDEERSTRRRRRPRRRRRGGRRDQEPAEEGAREEPEAGDLEAEEVTELRGPAPVRDTREEREEEDREEEDEEDQDQEDEDHDGDEDEDEEADSGERLSLKHKKIPTWQQAVEAIISGNMEARTKNSGGGGGTRGRGRRWRK